MEEARAGQSRKKHQFKGHPSSNKGQASSPAKGSARLVQAQEHLTNQMRKQPYSTTSLATIQSNQLMQPQVQYLKHDFSQPLIQKSMYRKVYKPKPDVRKSQPNSRNRSNSPNARSKSPSEAPIQKPRQPYTNLMKGRPIPAMIKPVLYASSPKKTNTHIA